METEQKPKVFAEGIIFKKPRVGAPDFVKGNMSIKIEEAIPFLQKYAKDGWVNLDLKISKKDTLYLELNDWKPTDKPTEKPKGDDFGYPVASMDDFNSSNLAF